MLTQSLPYWPINPAISSNPWFNFQLDFVRVHVGDPAGRDSLGRELPARARVGRDRRQGSGPPRRRRLCRQHARRDHRLGHREPAAGRLARQPARAAGAHHHLRRLGAADARVRGRRSRVEEVALPVRRHAAARGRHGRRRAARAHGPAGAGRARRLRPLCRHPRRRSRGHLHGRRVERLGRGHAAVERRAQLPQRRQGPGLERAAGHAPAADARPHDDAHPEEPGVGPRDRLRRGRDGRRRLGRSGRQAPHDRRDRAARAGRRRPATSRNTTSTWSRTRRRTSCSTTRGISC